MLVALLVAVEAPSVVRAPFVLIYATTLPGWSMIRLLRLGDLLIEAVFSLAMSLTIVLLLSYVMVATEFWRPFWLYNLLIIITVVCAVAALAMAPSAPDRNGLAPLK